MDRLIGGDMGDLSEQMVSDYVEIHDALAGYGEVRTSDFCRYSRMRRQGATQRAVLWQIAMDRTDKRVRIPAAVKPEGQQMTRLTVNCEGCAKLKAEIASWKAFGRLATLIMVCAAIFAVTYTVAIATATLSR